MEFIGKFFPAFKAFILSILFILSKIAPKTV